MAQPFDTTLKHLLEAHPADCLRLVDLPTAAPIEVIDADLATVSAEADKVFRIREREPWLMHFELQASYDAQLPQRMLRYNVLLKSRHGLPVDSAVILLRPKADGREMTGRVRHTRAGETYLEFRYRVVRLWRKPVESILTGGIGTLPLAPLADVRQSDLDGVVGAMKRRFRTEVPKAEEATLWTATYLLMGLRYNQDVARALLRGVMGMEESVTYQEIINKGEAKGMAKEAQRILLLVGTNAFGEPDAATRAAVEAITDPTRLEALIVQVLSAKDWHELLQKPRARRNGHKRR